MLKIKKKYYQKKKKEVKCLKHQNDFMFSKLPSKKLQFSQWHELRLTELKGNQLKAPRVRKGKETFILMDIQIYQII